MIPFLFPFIADTVIAPPMDYTDLFVNEWGVVVFNSMGATVAGAPDEEGNIPYGRETFMGPIMVDAPVIWIHGAFFEDATLTVKAAQGTLTTLFPEPDEILDKDEPVVASWNISAPPPVARRERPELVIPEGTPFGWAMGRWREVPSLDLFSSRSGDYMSNFLYYETEIPFWDTPDGIYDAKVLAGFYSPEGLIITTGDQPRVQRIQLIPLPDGSGTPPEQSVELTDLEISDVLCGWAAGNLKSQEIDALWDTWKPFFVHPEMGTDVLVDMECPVDRVEDSRSTGETWILFPLPWDVVEGISTLHLDVHDMVDREITYNRLFLGLVRLY